MIDAVRLLVAIIIWALLVRGAWIVITHYME
jgi:hypothetical protein